MAKAKGRLYIKISFLLSLFFVAMFASTPMVTGLTPESTLIEARAQGIYRYDGDVYTTWSNWTSIRVGQIGAVEIQPKSIGGDPQDSGFNPALMQYAAPGQRIEIPFFVTNRGNGQDTIQFTPEVFSGRQRSGAILDLVVYHDVNNDGYVDTHDPIVTELTLDAGESAALIVQARVSRNAVTGESEFLRLIVRSHFDEDVVAENSWVQIQVADYAPSLTVRRQGIVHPGPAWSDAHNSRQPESGWLHIASGDAVEHTIIIDNVGNGAASEVLVVDPLAAIEQLDTNEEGEYEAIIINGRKVPLHTNDPWRARLVSSPTGEQTLEITLENVVPSQRVVIQYTTQIEGADDVAKDVQKTAHVFYAVGGNEEAEQYSNTLTMSYVQKPSLRIMPAGVLPLPGTDNTISIDMGVAGQIVPVQFTVYNTGMMAGTVMLETGKALPTEWEVVFYEEDGQTPLQRDSFSGSADGGRLEPGEQREYVAHITLPSQDALIQSPPYIINLSAYFQHMPERHDTMAVRFADVLSVIGSWDPLLLFVSPEQAVSPGQMLTYELLFGNQTNTDVEEVVIVKQLSPYLDPPAEIYGTLEDLSNVESLAAEKLEGRGMEYTFSAQAKRSHLSQSKEIVGTYDPDRHAIVWKLPVMPADTGGWLTAHVPIRDDTPEQAIIEVTGTLESHLSSSVVTSNTVVNAVLSEQMTVDMVAERSQVRIGDRQTFTLTVHNVNPTATMHNVEVHVQFSAGLTYDSHNTVLDGSVTGPFRDEHSHVFVIDEMEPNEKQRFTLKTIVNAVAEQFVHAEAKVLAPQGGNQWITSLPVYVSTPVIPDGLKNDNMIVGRVVLPDHVDSNGGQQGVAQVRVVLDNGRYAITDKQGYFTFTTVQPGPRVLRIEAGTVFDNSSLAHIVNVADLQQQRIIVFRDGIAFAQFVLPVHDVHITTSERVVEGAEQ